MSVVCVYNVKDWEYYLAERRGSVSAWPRISIYIYTLYIYIINTTPACQQKRKYYSTFLQRERGEAVEIYRPEAEFLDVIGTKVLRVFLLAIFTVTSIQ
jgi:hypothetical protein